MSITAVHEAITAKALIKRFFYQYVELESQRKSRFESIRALVEYSQISEHIFHF